MSKKLQELVFSAVCCGTGKRTFQIVLLQERLENKCNPPKFPDDLNGQQVSEEMQVLICDCRFVFKPTGLDVAINRQRYDGIGLLQVEKIGMRWKKIKR
jgi:hypothetical protein